MRLACAVVAALVASAEPAAAQRAAGQEMVRISGGAYTIGTGEGPRDAMPPHSVALEPFLIDRHEVTNADFAAFLNALEVRPARPAAAGRVGRADVDGRDADRLFEADPGAGRPRLVELDDEHSRIAIARDRFVPQPGYERHPMVEVTWHGASAYCASRGARLPTEAEWEAAARGREARSYPWGEAAPTPERAVYGRRSGATERVGARPAGATPDGIHDLAGNVAEWTSTLYRAYPYGARDGREDPNRAGERVTRGGDHVFDSAPDRLTAFFRAGFSRAPERGHRHIGFRCARSP